MSTSGSDSTQTLTASGGTGLYTWSIPGGSGTLSSSNGSSIIYTAPGSNANRANDPTIRLTDSTGQHVDLTMAVNGYQGHVEAVRISAEPWCNTVGVVSTCGMTTYHYDCHGDLMAPPYYSLPNPCYSTTNSVWGCDDCLNSSLICDNCSTYCGAISYKISLSPEDRTLQFPYLQNGGCGPALLPPAIGPGDTGGSASGAPNACFNSSVNVKSGNLHDSIDVAGLRLYYNSMGSTSYKPIGPRWTHNYNATLTANDSVTLVLSTGDGNMVYFRLSAGVYYPEPRSGDTSTIMKNSNGTYTRTMKDGAIYQFDYYGNLTSVTDRNGNTTTLTYTSGRLTSITDTNGRTTTLTYASGGVISSITDPGGRIYTLTNAGYSNYLFTGITDPLGHTWSFTYNSTVGQMHTKTDPAGKTTTYTYDVKGKLLTSTDPESKTRSIDYPQPGTINYTEKDGGVWTYTYDPTYAVMTSKTDPLGNTTSYAYDLKRNLISTTDPNGGVTIYTYDSNNNRMSVTDPLGNVTSYTYNSMNLVASQTDPRGAVTTYAYDTNGNLITLTAPLGAVTTFQYDSKGNVTSITDANNHTTVLAYDSHNNLASITDALSNQTTFTYDAVGNRLTMTDPLGNVTYYTYNNINQMTQVTDPKGNVTHFTYDYKGNVLTTTDANGNPTTYAYNYRGQVTQITDALNHLTQMSYGPSGCGSGCSGAGKLTALTDALNHTTQYTYDLAGRLIRETDPLGKEINYTYDGKGNLITSTKADGKAIIYTYDANNRLIEKQYSDGTITQYRYDGNGNMTYAGNSAIAYNFAYDTANRLKVVTDSNGRSIQYQYDIVGNRVKMITPEGKAISYAYDETGRLTALITDKGAFSLTYDADGRRSKLTYPNKTAATYTYDASDNLTGIRYTGPNGGVITEVNYTYDNVNNRLTKTDTAKVATYRYDAIYRLLQSSLTDRRMPLNPLPGGEAYMYDSVGNRLQGPAGPDYLTYDTGNELQNFNSTIYAYDLNGNRTKKIEASSAIQKNMGITTYSYDDEKRLTRVEISGIPSRVITYAYDPLGRRIQKNINGIITNYVYDKEAIILTYDQKGTVTARYTHGPGIDEPLSMGNNSQTYYYHADGLGSIVNLTNANGIVAQIYAYDSFGNMLPQLASIGQSYTCTYTYTAREYDSETGLYFYRARYYDPKVGRFLQRDPIGSKGKETNLYSYANNNPIGLTDPLGLYTEVGVRPFYPYKAPYARHCFVRFNGDNNDTLSYDNTGVRKDPNPGGATYSKTTGEGCDDCVRNEMNKCKGADYCFGGFNCCMCVSNALNACGLKKEGSWPNSPYSAGNPPYSPGCTDPFFF